MEEKRCGCCKKTFPLTTEYFYRHSESPDGFQSWHIECSRLSAHEREERQKSATKNYLYKILKSPSEDANRERRADISELIEDYNLGIGSLPGEARELRETDTEFIVALAEGREISVADDYTYDFE